MSSPWNRFINKNGEGEDGKEDIDCRWRNSFIYNCITGTLGLGTSRNHFALVYFFNRIKIPRLGPLKLKFIWIAFPSHSQLSSDKIEFLSLAFRWLKRRFLLRLLFSVVWLLPAPTWIFGMKDKHKLPFFITLIKMIVCYNLTSFKRYFFFSASWWCVRSTSLSILHNNG